MKRIALFLALVTVAAACSSSPESSSSPDSSQPTTDSSQPTVDSSEADEGSVTTSIGDDGASLVPNQTIAPPEGPLAPDFTLALGDGTSFTLSEQAMPVYMIFWADW